MLVTLLVNFRNKDCKTTELGLLLQVLPIRIVTFIGTLGSHLNASPDIFADAPKVTSHWGTGGEGWCNTNPYIFVPRIPSVFSTEKNGNKPFQIHNGTLGHSRYKKFITNTV